MAKEIYQSNYGGESSAFGIAAIGNVANDTINLLRLWIKGDVYENQLDFNYLQQLRSKEKIVKLIVAGIIVVFLLKK